MGFVLCFTLPCPVLPVCWCVYAHTYELNIKHFILNWSHHLRPPPLLIFTRPSKCYNNTSDHAAGVTGWSDVGLGVSKDVSVLGNDMED